MRLHQRTVLLTGASGGLGRHMASALGAAGATVALAGRRRDALDALRDELRARGATAETVVCDLATPGTIERLAEDAEAAVGPSTCS